MSMSLRWRFMVVIWAIDHGKHSNPGDLEPLLDALNESIVRLLQAINPTRIA